MNVAASPLVAYLGWHGKGNLGDDAIYDAVRSQLSGSTFLDLPRFAHERLMGATTGFNRSLRGGTQVVGGGTLIGRRDWRLRVNAAATLTTNKAGYAIGVGVEDPAFVARWDVPRRGELRRWKSILSEFQMVSVRGPRSAELLADIGLTVEVSGDPALLLPQPQAKPEEGLIGLNLGFGIDLWGHDRKKVAEETARAVRELSSQGFRFVGILMNSADKRWTQAALGDVVADIVQPTDAEAAARELARCSVSIVSRLHAGILAALSATPVISLEYQPKCRDFALSIDDERSLLRTDTLRSSDLVDAVHGAIADSSGIRAKTNSAVRRLRGRLLAEYATLAANLGIRD